MTKVKVACAQYPITEHANWDAWQKHTESWVADAAGEGAELLLFPEYGSMELVSTIDQSFREDVREQINALNELRDQFCAVFEDLARKYNVIIIAPTIPVVENGRNLNRAFVFSPKGLAGYQDKFFMTRFEDEEWGIQSAPKTLAVFEASWGKFGVQICYDIEFALGSQLLCAAGASLILAPSCTETIRGATRVHVGARARALENQAYTAISQTIGNAPWSPAVDINYGYAACYSTPDHDLPEEGILSQMQPQTEGWLYQELDFTKIENVRSNGQVLNFRDLQHIQPSILEEDITVVYCKV